MTIDLSKTQNAFPDKVDGKWLWRYKCQNCGGKTRVIASSFKEKRPVPSKGGINCPHCKQ